MSHTQTPSANRTAITASASGVASAGPASHAASHASSVPAVPGAQGERPAPKPNATQRAGCAAAKRSAALAEDDHAKWSKPGLKVIGLPWSSTARRLADWMAPMRVSGKPSSRQRQIRAPRRRAVKSSS